VTPSSQPPTISANGNLLSGKRSDGEILEIIIDGTVLSGGSNSPTLLGDSEEFLPASKQFSLIDFQPLPDGRCLLRYQKLNPNITP